MPTISLRLTDEEHAQLRAWAYGNQRSIQRETIFRLFSMHHIPTRSGAGEVILADSQPRDVEARTLSERGPTQTHTPTGSEPRHVGGRPRSESDDHFKPDFGNKLK